MPNRPDNPRRPPAYKSVSLRHSSPPAPKAASHDGPGRKNRSRVPSSNLANPPSSQDSTSDIRKESSGESSTAERWFERSNNDVQANTSTIADLEPPFFLKNSSSSETPPDGNDSGRMLYSDARQSMLPYRSAFMPMDTQGSSSEEFRSVIDDLTVENKKLKRKLRKYEKLYDVHLQQEKLFEIRVHDLPAQKKRELEETLRKFAQSLGANSPTNMSSGYADSTPAALDQKHTTSSHTSTRFADSAYASNAPSGQESGQISHAPSAIDRGSRKLSKHATTASRNHDIQSYLHDIPSTLLPRQPVAMTEKAKRKLLVRRLEQIFAGKGAAVGGHQQPMQQQEVSQSAAHADRMEIEAAGQQAMTEGLREAQIMPKKPDTTQAIEPSDHAKTVDHEGHTDKLSSEQRPTRPLDLDLHRAQVPQDNIKYIRHLGFSPADFEAAESVDEHGYIYLNVLTNMAQLHTLNVTTDFVKQSIEDYSDKLTLSRDGRKVRWKGGQDVTKTSSDGSPSGGTPNSSQAPRKRGRKHPAIDRKISDGTSSDSAAKAPQAGPNNKLAYVPLFFHKQDSADDSMTSDEQITSWSSPQQGQITGNSSGFTSSGVRTQMSKRRRRDDGPIIFYNKAKFCTDLSGDHDPDDSPQQPAVKYNTLVADPVGVAAVQASNDTLQYDRKGALADGASFTADEMDVDSNLGAELGSGAALRFSPKAGLVSGPHVTSPQPDFEVSGLGGVQPSDHFRIEVQSRRTSTVGQSTPNAAHFARNKFYPQRLREILGARQRSEGDSSPAIEEEVVSTNHHDLPTSVLPEPVTLFTLSSYGDESDDEMADDTGLETDISDFDDDIDGAPSAAPQMFHFSSQSSDEEEELDEESSSDGSVDFLAAARKVDPQTVHEREREYDANMAERLAEEIPAGSSAATAGGGSGFNSPSGPHKVVADGKSIPDLMKRQSSGKGPGSAKKPTAGAASVDAIVDGAR